MNKLLIIFCLVAVLSCRGWAFTKIDLGGYDQVRPDDRWSNDLWENWSVKNHDFNYKSQMNLVFNNSLQKEYYIRIAGVEGAVENYITLFTTLKSAALNHSLKLNIISLNYTSPPL